MNYIAHHGIKGQQWGVRNGPPYPIDKEAAKQFADAVTNVNRKASNEYTAFEAKPTYVKNIEDAAKVTNERARECIDVASRMYEKAKAEEPAITKNIVKAADENDCKLYGLENRLKQPESIARKLATDSIEKDLTLKETEKTIGDTIRYTVISNESDFVSNYISIRDQLVDDGYAETRCRNYFTLYKQGLAMHKSVVSKFQTRSGQTFEVQFQTPSSQASKNLRTPLYEERRQVGVDESRAKEIEKQMVNLAERVTNPPDIFTIGDELKHSAMIIYKRRY